MVTGILLAVIVLLAADEDAMSHARRSYALQAAGQGVEAEQELREAVRLEPQNPLFHSALSGLLVQAHRTEEAIRELETALDHKPGEPVRQKLSGRLEELMLSYGEELGRQGSFQNGLALSRRAAFRFPNSSSTLEMLGFFQTKERLNVEAVTSYQRALALDPKSVDTAIGLAVAQAAAGMEAEAVQAMESGIAVHPSEPRFLQALGGLLLARPAPTAAETTRARMLLEQALRLRPDLAESHYQLGSLDLRAGALDSAAQHLETAARLDPRDGRVHFALAKLYRKQNRTEEAQRETELFSRSALAAQNQ